MDESQGDASELELYRLLRVIDLLTLAVGGG